MAIDYLCVYEDLHERMSYDPDTGDFTWLTHKRGERYVGKTAGSKHSNGYWMINWNRKTWPAHRLAWLYMTGEWPDLQVDHLNGVCTDNRWSNLALKTARGNALNRPMRSDNKTGVTGVYISNGRFLAQIRKKHIGIYDTLEEATDARRQAEDDDPLMTDTHGKRPNRNIGRTR